MSLQGECGEGGTGPQPGHHQERGGAREQLRRKDHPVGKDFFGWASVVLRLDTFYAGTVSQQQAHVRPDTLKKKTLKK